MSKFYNNLIIVNTFDVQCTVYNVHCTLYSVQCTLYNIYYIK